MTAALTAAASSVLPFNFSSAIANRMGKSVTAPTPMAMRLHPPSPLSSTCAAAATNAKSLRRAFTSWKPTPIFPGQMESCTDVNIALLGKLVVMGPM